MQCTRTKSESSIQFLTNIKSQQGDPGKDMPLLICTVERYGINFGLGLGKKVPWEGDYPIEARLG